MARSTRLRVRALTFGWVLRTRETVWWDTPARRATSSMTGGRGALFAVISWCLLSGGENAPGCLVRGARLQPDQVHAAVEGIGRAGHGFHSEAQPVGGRGLLVRGVDLDPLAGAVPGHSDAGTPGIPDQHAGLAGTVERYVREGVVDLGVADGARRPEIKTVAFHGARFLRQQPVRGDLEELPGGELEGPLVERRRACHQVGVRADTVGR